MTTYEIRACYIVDTDAGGHETVESYSLADEKAATLEIGQRPDFYGVYTRDEDDRLTHVSDHETPGEAQQRKALLESCDHRPCDHQYPCNCCKDCGARLTWVGPGFNDYEEESN